MGGDQISFDVLTGDYVNVVKAGIIDPARVTRGALENAASKAASTAALILSTDTPNTDKPKPSENGRLPGGTPPDMDEMD